MDKIIMHFPKTYDINVRWNDNIIYPEKITINYAKYIVTISPGNHELKISESNLLSTKVWILNSFVCILDSLLDTKKYGFYPDTNKKLINIICKKNTTIELKIFFDKKDNDQLVNELKSSIIVSFKNETLIYNNILKKRWLITNIIAILLIGALPIGFFLVIMFLNIMNGSNFFRGGLIFVILIFAFMTLEIMAIKKVFNQYKTFD